MPYKSLQDKQARGREVSAVGHTYRGREVPAAAGSPSVSLKHGKEFSQEQSLLTPQTLRLPQPHSFRQACLHKDHSPVQRPGGGGLTANTWAVSTTSSSWVSYTGGRGPANCAVIRCFLMMGADVSTQLNPLTHDAGPMTPDAATVSWGRHQRHRQQKKK